MEKNNLSKLNNYLQKDFETKDDIWLTSTYTLRKVVGLLGMALPLLLFIFLWIIGEVTQPLESISHYYYTRVSGIFVAIMSILAIFLIIYKGSARVDLIVSLIAGIAALFVVFFPTDNLGIAGQVPAKAYAVTHLPINEFRENLHLAAAAIFLGCLGYMSFFLFTKSNKVSKEAKGKKKIARNRIYRTCAVIMAAAMGVIFFGGFCNWIPEDVYRDHELTFWMEAVAVERVGFSWIVKGETLFKDE